MPGLQLEGLRAGGLIRGQKLQFFPHMSPGGREGGISPGLEAGLQTKVALGNLMMAGLQTKVALGNLMMAK